MAKLIATIEWTCEGVCAGNLVEAVGSLLEGLEDLQGLGATKTALSISNDEGETISLGELG